MRDAASQSAQIISESLPQETFQDQYASMLSRLATKEWFTARISSAALMASAYSKLTPEQQQEHMTLFAQLCQDDTPMVRRVSAQYLGKMVQNVVEASGRQSLEENGSVTKILIPLFEELASNEQPVSEKMIRCVSCRGATFPSLPNIRSNIQGFCPPPNDGKLCGFRACDGEVSSRKPLDRVRKGFDHAAATTDCSNDRR